MTPLKYCVQEDGKILAEFVSFEEAIKFADNLTALKNDGTIWENDKSQISIYHEQFGWIKDRKGYKKC